MTNPAPEESWNRTERSEYIDNINPYLRDGWRDLLQQQQAIQPKSSRSDGLAPLQLFETKAQVPPEKSAAPQAPASEKGEPQKAEPAGADRLTAELKRLELGSSEHAGLISKLTEQHKPDIVSSALEQLSEPNQARELLKILAEAKLPVASQQLIEMLQPGSSRTAIELLRALSSPIAADRTHGQRMLKLLNSASEQDRHSSRAILGMIPDIHQRQNALDMLQTDATKKGMEVMLEQLQLPGQRSRQTAEKLLAMLGEESFSKTRNTKALLELFGGSPEQKTAAERILQKLDNPGHITTMLKLKSTTPEAYKVLDSWLHSKDQNKQSAAEAFLEVDDALSQHAPKLTHMLADVAQRDRAQSILSVGNPGAINRLLDLANSENYQKGAEQIMRMLESNSKSEQKSARSLMEMFSSSPYLADSQEGERHAAALALFGMLEKPEQASIAKRVLTSIEDPILRGRFTTMFKQHEPTALKLLQRIEDPKSDTGIKVLQAFDSARQVGAYFATAESIKGTASEYALNSMLQTGGTKTLLRLAYGTESDRELGTRMLKELAESRQLVEPIRKILDADLSGDQCAQLMALRDDPSKKRAFGILLDATNKPESLERAGLDTLLNLLSEKETRGAAEAIIREFNDPNTSKTQCLETLAALKKREDLYVLGALFEIENYKPAARQLMQMFNTDEPANDPTIRLLRMLRNTDEEQRIAADRVLKLLGNEDKQAQKLGRAITDTFSSPLQIAEFIRLTDKSLAKSPEQLRTADILTEMLLSKNAAERRGAQNLMLAQTVDVGKRYGEHLLKMLGGPNLKDQAKTILTAIPDPVNLLQMTRVIMNPKRAALSQLLMDGLNSNDPSRRRSVSAFLGRAADGEKEDAGGLYTPQELESYLSNPKTRELLYLADSPETLTQVANLLQRPNGEKLLAHLKATKEDKAQSGAAQAILESTQSAVSIEELITRLQDPAKKDSAQVIVDLLKDENPPERFTGNRICEYLSNQNPKVKLAGEQLLQMVQDPNELKLAKRIVLAAQTPEQTAKLLGVLSDQKMQTAASVLKELLTSTEVEELRVVGQLTLQLTRGTPAEKAAADELLMLLNTERHRETALKRLKNSR